MSTERPQRHVLDELLAKSVQAPPARGLRVQAEESSEEPAPIERTAPPEEPTWPSHPALERVEPRAEDHDREAGGRREDERRGPILRDTRGRAAAPRRREGFGNAAENEVQVGRGPLALHLSRAATEERLAESEERLAQAEKRCHEAMRELEDRDARIASAGERLAQTTERLAQSEKRLAALEERLMMTEESERHAARAAGARRGVARGAHGADRDDGGARAHASRGAGRRARGTRKSCIGARAAAWQLRHARRRSSTPCTRLPGRSRPCSPTILRRGRRTVVGMAGTPAAEEGQRRRRRRPPIPHLRSQGRPGRRGRRPTCLRASPGRPGPPPPDRRGPRVRQSLHPRGPRSRPPPVVPVPRARPRSTAKRGCSAPSSRSSNAGARTARPRRAASPHHARMSRRRRAATRGVIRSGA